VRVQSIGWRTDVSLRELEGAEIDEHEDHLIVRTAENPTYRWGNFLLFDSPPHADDAKRWISRFEAAFPTADYVAIGFDSPSGEHGELAGFATAGMTVSTDAVLRTSVLRPPPREPPDAVFRAVHSEHDWQQTEALRLANDGHGQESSYCDFLERQMRAIRSVCERGHGVWFGAFRDGEMYSSLGIFNAGAGLARFQNVDTHPEHRGQGLASHLLLAAGHYALTQLEASTLVIAADPDYLAIDIYRSLGFRDLERHTQLERLPT
jgi:ribosomal protein S18 acetylase RimI-like enzyme